MMDKPPWINEVKEIDREEAIVLISLGVPVGMDYYRVDKYGWDDRPRYDMLLSEGDVPAEDRRFVDVFYVKPGETNESTS